MTRLSVNIQKTVDQLSSNMRIARKRRRWTQRDMALKMGVSIGTVQRLEDGDAGVSIGTIAKGLLALGCMDRLGKILEVSTDHIGNAAEIQNLPNRVHNKRRITRDNDRTVADTSDEDILAF